MIDYVLKNIEPEQWKEFKAVASLQGKTVRDKFLEYIRAQARMLPTMVLFKDRSKKSFKKGGK